MRNSRLLKIIAAITLFVVLAGLIHYAKPNGTQDDRSKGEQAAQQYQEVQGAQTAQEKQSQEEGKRFLESFLVTYNSYRLGDASNIESLYSSMSESMLKQEKEKVKRLEKNYGDYKGYTTVQPEIKSSEVEIAEENRIVLKVALEMSTIEGAFVPDPDSDKVGDVILVDRIGSRYSGPTADLVSKKETAVFRIVGVRESQDWKVSEVNKIIQ